MSFLQEYQGCLQCDAYPGYNGLFARGKVVEVACWAYARRNFVDAAKTSAGVAHEAVARIKGLYAVEHEARDIDSGQRALLRQEKSVPFGRKNWLFFGSDRGGRTLAILASFTVTCEQFGINPWTYLRDTLTHLPEIPLDRVDTLLPTK